MNRLAAAQAGFPFGEWGWKIHFVDEMTGFVSLENFTDGAILRTDDGGRAWTRLQVNDPQDNANLEGIGFVDAQQGWVGGWGNRAFTGGFSSATGDGGNSWQDANHIGKYLNRFRFIRDPLVGYASGDTVYRYAPVTAGAEAVLAAPVDGERSAVRSGDSEVHARHLIIAVDVQPGVSLLEVDVWDRFGDHLGTIHSESDPPPGRKEITWQFPEGDAALAVEHFIYRVALDDRVESRVVLHSKAATADVVVTGLQERLRASRGTNGTPPLPTVAEEKEAFHRLANIEDYPDFRSVAKELATAYLANADYGALSLYEPFAFTDAAFEQRMSAIYAAALPDMHRPYRFDRDVVIWENGRRYRVGRASDTVVRDQLLQLAPFNLMDGVWLQNIMQAGPSDEVRSRLFEIWADEVGGGEPRENHSNVYLTLLRSEGMEVPDVTSRRFIEMDLAPGAWRTAVFQMTIGLFPQDFFPELLGMTLFLEWEATPTLTPKVNMLRARGMNPLFYSLHVAIDNISEGHGALAKEAVKIFLEEKREEGGERAVQEHWRRIWNGYVGWATAGFNGAGMEERRLVLDRVSINVGTPDEPKCFPDWRAHYHGRMVEMITRKAPFASQVHGRLALEGVLLNDLFARPEELMEKLIASGTVDIEHPRRSRFFELMEFEGPMYKVFSEDEKTVILDWLESLSDGDGGCIDPLPDAPLPEPLPERMTALIQTHAPLAKRAHGELALPDAAGERVPLVEFFDRPAELMAAMMRGGWVVPHFPERSLFVTRILQNGGPMQGILGPDELDVVTEWIADGAQLPAGELEMVDAPTRELVARARVPSEIVNEYSRLKPFIGQGAVH